MVTIVSLLRNSLLRVGDDFDLDSPQAEWMFQVTIFNCP